MEATVAASVPPTQTALSVQPSPKNNSPTHSTPRKNLSTSSPSRKLTTPTQNIPQNTVVLAPHSPHTTIAAPQDTRPKSEVIKPSSPQRTLPAVQDFLQKAYNIVQLQNVTKTAQSSKLGAVLTQSSLQNNADNISMQTTVPIAQPLPSKSDTVTQGSTPTPHTALHTPDKDEATHIEQSKTPTNLKQASNAGTSRNSSNTNELYFYNSAYQGKRFHKRADPEKRSVLVGKRRNHDEANIVISSEIKESAETLPKDNSAKTSETKSSKDIPQAPIEHTSNTINAPSTQSAQTPASTVNLNICEMQNTQSAQNSESKRPNVSEKSLSSKDSAAKHGNSRVVQTYHMYKANQRSQNGAQTSTQFSRNSRQENQAVGGSARPNGPRDKETEPDSKKKVIVTGFPPYTQSQDLTRVLSTIGACQVDKCRNRLAVVTFEHEKAAREAVKASDEICIYGEFIEIAPYTNPRHVEEMFRAYKKVIATQKGQDIIQPKQIDLSGDFYQQMENIQNAIRLTREQVAAVSNLYMDLEMVLQQEWPGCVAIPFGSIPTGLGIKSSDADCYVQLPGGAAAGAARRSGGGAAFVQRARRLLALYPRVFTQLVAIPRANTPIVKFHHVPSGFHCDVSSKTPLGAQNSKLVKLLLELDARAPPVALLVKYWARAHGLTGTGRLTNYALTLMVLFYLQRPPAALLPPVERLQRDPRTHYIVDNWNAGFGPAPPAPAPPCAAAVPDLLGGFFRFYAAFDFDSLVVCPYLGSPVPKASFAAGAPPPEMARYAANVRAALASPIRHGSPFCVQDPLEQSHNVASSVGAKLAADICAHFRFAADAYAADRAAGCRSFLRTVLLQRPRLPRERPAPSSKVFLIPRVRSQLAAADWRARVRTVLVDLIFEHVLRIRLERDRDSEEAERPKAETKAGVEPEKSAQASSRVRRKNLKMDKEKYTGSATKPVWRRRKNYASSSPEPEQVLLARQRAATEQTLAAPELAPLRFSLELAFHDQPQHCYVVADLLEGAPDAFRGFVIFMHTAMFDWFRILVRPYLTPPELPALPPAEQPVEPLAKQPTDAPAKQTADAPAKQPANAPAEPPAEPLAEQPAEPSAEPHADADAVGRRLAAVALAHSSPAAVDGRVR